MLPSNFRNFRSRIMSEYSRTIFACLIVFIIPAVNACAAELLPAESNMADVIDHYVREQLVQKGVSAVQPADPLTLLRRTHWTLPVEFQRQKNVNGISACRKPIDVDRWWIG